LLRRLLLTSAVLLAALVAVPAAHARPASDIAGVAVHPWQLGSNDARERVFSGIAATGARWVRVDMPWAWVEEHGPTIRNGHGAWGSIDPIVSSATRHGLKLIPILGFTPKWASDSGELWAYPDSRPFEDFFSAALRRYPQIPAWELWNEPNFERFSKPWPDPARFVEFLRAARHARDSVGSTAKLISGGIAPGGEIDMVSWINQVGLRGGLTYIDGLGVHPYSPADPDDPASSIMQLQAIHEQLAELGRPDLPLYLTEYGAPTTTVANGYAPALTEQQQADRLRTAFALASRFDWIENLTWYEYRDSCTDKLDPECNFGLVHNNLSHKPSWDALRDVIAGTTAKLRPRLLLSTKIREAPVPVASAAKRRPSKRHPKKRHPSKRHSKKRAVKRITVNRITVSGRLTLPGTQWPNAILTVMLPRRGAPPKPAQILVKEGYFWARFEGRALQSGTLETRYGGSDAYQPLTAQIQVLSSVTTIR
jgi:polysaccharide biosynthesis protein PslG